VNGLKGFRQIGSQLVNTFDTSADDDFLNVSLIVDPAESRTPWVWGFKKKTFFFQLTLRVFDLLIDSQPQPHMRVKCARGQLKKRFFFSNPLENPQTPGVRASAGSIIVMTMLNFVT